MRAVLPLTLLTACAPPHEGDAARLVRLTATQWELATAELLALDAPSGLSSRFVPDPATGRFDNDADALEITPILVQQYQAAATQLAEDAVNRPARYAEIVGRTREEGGGSGARDAWLEGFGRRAFRRPLTDEERTAYAALFRKGREIHDERTPFVAGVQLSIAGFLQSPHFLYRVERAAPGEAVLEPQSFASRLSFALWNAAPDATLLDRAESAGDAADLLAEVPRMLDDPRGHAMIRDLHRQLLHVDAYANIPRDFMSYEDYATTANAAMEAEVEAFVDRIVYGDGTVEDLLTSRHTSADANIAAIYGVPLPHGEGAEALTPVVLDPDERAGLLTLSGFLAMHSSETSEDLIRRGAFVHEAVLCNALPPPPANATALPLEDDDTGAPETMRERITAHTAECGGACHADLLNPIAFAFGQYDELGRYRADPDIDTWVEFAFPSGPLEFDGAVELAEILASEERVHRCYASHLLSYLEGRTLTSDDNARVDALAARSVGGAPILGLIEDIVEDEAFRSVR